MIDPKQFHDHVIEPALIHFSKTYKPSINTLAARRILLGTALCESNLTYLKQLGGGPALGLYQMEPDTHDDIWRNYVNYRDHLHEALIGFGQMSDGMISDLSYATVMARMQYWRVKEELPDANDAPGLAMYYKRHYNTDLGKADVIDALPNFQTAIEIIQE